VNYIAKRAGVKTGMALWQARQVCPEIAVIQQIKRCLFRHIKTGLL